MPSRDVVHETPMPGWSASQAASRGTASRGSTRTSARRWAPPQSRSSPTGGSAADLVGVEQHDLVAAHLGQLAEHRQLVVGTRRDDGAGVGHPEAGQRAERQPPLAGGERQAAGLAGLRGHAAVTEVPDRRADRSRVAVDDRHREAAPVGLVGVGEADDAGADDDEIGTVRQHGTDRAAWPRPRQPPAPAAGTRRGRATWPQRRLDAGDEEGT